MKKLRQRDEVKITNQSEAPLKQKRWFKQTNKQTNKQTTALHHGWEWTFKYLISSSCFCL